MFKKIADDQRFHSFITWTIVFAGVIIGMETSPILRHDYSTLFRIFDIAILTIFIVEIIIKIGAEGRKPWRYFMDPWNIFDFTMI